MLRPTPRRFGLWLGLLFCATAHAADPKPLEFNVTFTKEVSAKPFTGRVYLMLTKARGGVRPPASVNWFNPEPLFAKDVKDWKPGEPLVIGADALAHPVKLDKLPAGEYTAFAVMDFDRGNIHFSNAPGNGHSAPLRQMLNAATTGPVSLTINQVAPAECEFKETDRVKLVDIESKLLSAFHKRPIRLRGSHPP